MAINSWKTACSANKNFETRFASWALVCKHHTIHALTCSPRSDIGMVRQKWWRHLETPGSTPSGRGSSPKT